MRLPYLLNKTLYYFSRKIIIIIIITIIIVIIVSKLRFSLPFVLFFVLFYVNLIYESQTNADLTLVRQINE